MYSVMKRKLAVAVIILAVLGGVYVTFSGQTATEYSPGFSDNGVDGEKAVNEGYFSSTDSVTIEIQQKISERETSQTIYVNRTEREYHVAVNRNGYKTEDYYDGADSFLRYGEPDSYAYELDTKSSFDYDQVTRKELLKNLLSGIFHSAPEEDFIQGERVLIYTQDSGQDVEESNYFYNERVTGFFEFNAQAIVAADDGRLIEYTASAKFSMTDETTGEARNFEENITVTVSDYDETTVNKPEWTDEVNSE